MAEVNTWDTEFEFALEIVKKGGEIIKNAFLRYNVAKKYHF